MEPLVLIFRDRHESLAKCSLTPVREHPELRFVEYPRENPVDASGRVLLHPEGTLLSEADRGSLLVLLDSSWRRLPKLLRKLEGDPPRRRLPPLQTAYPRRSSSFPDPDQGLASIEALYAALLLLGHPRPELLAGYRWRDEFLARNPGLVDGSAPGPV